MRTHRPLFAIGLTLAAITLITLTLSTAIAQPETDKTAVAAERNQHWREDIDAAVSGVIERHKNAFHAVSRDDFIAAADDLKASVPNLPDHLVVVGLQRIIAMVGDAHTSVMPWSARYKVFELPLDFAWFSDGVFITAADAEHRDLIGAKVLKIGATPIDEACTKLAAVVARENDQWMKSMVRQWLRFADVLQGTGVTDRRDLVRYELTLRSGESKSIEVEARVPTQQIRFVSDWDTKLDTLPLSRRPREGGRLYDHRFDEATGALYAWYDQCSDQRGQPTVFQWSAEVLKIIDERPVKSVIIDLRRNAGGNSALLMPLIDGLARRDAINQPNKLFVLIGQRTFSSGMMNAAELRAGTKATLVGTPTGGKPNSYGEVKTFTLPHSGLTVQYSTRFWKRAPEGEDPPSVMPDILADTDSAAFFAGRDPVMEAVLAATTP